MRGQGVRLRGGLPERCAFKEAKGVDAIVCLLADKIDGEVMDAAGSQLRVVANYAVGYDNIDVDAATKRGIMVTNYARRANGYDG